MMSEIQDMSNWETDSSEYPIIKTTCKECNATSSYKEPSSVGFVDSYRAMVARCVCTVVMS